MKELYCYKRTGTRGKVDSTRWEIVGWPIDSTLVDLGDGDWAMQLQDIAKGNAYNMGIRSRIGIPRGDNLRCTFRIWRDHQPLNWAALAGLLSIVTTCIGQSPNLSQVEAGFSRLRPHCPATLASAGLRVWNRFLTPARVSRRLCERLDGGHQQAARPLGARGVGQYDRGQMRMVHE